TIVTRENIKSEEYSRPAYRINRKVECRYYCWAKSEMFSHGPLTLFIETRESYKSQENSSCARSSEKFYYRFDDQFEFQDAVLLKSTSRQPNSLVYSLSWKGYLDTSVHTARLLYRKPVQVDRGLSHDYSNSNTPLYLWSRFSVPERIQATHDRQKSYVDVRHKPPEFQVGDKVMLKVSPWKGVIRFGKQRKLNLRYIGPFKVLAKVGTVAYRHELPQQLSRVHSTFYVSNLKKCLSDESLVIPLDEIHIDDKLHFVEEPVEIIDREVKRLKQSHIPIIKVRRNSRRGQEFTWECEDQFQKKYPYLFVSLDVLIVEEVEVVRLERLRIEQYFQVQDYALWDVIENGNSFKPAAQTTTNADGTPTSLIPGLVTTEEKVQKNNDVKARSMLLMALPNEHLMTSNQYKDAKTLFAAIQTRFGGNEATKKIQKTLLKQMYENFSALSTESLDSIFNRLQKIVSQLGILGENISQEDLNLKFLRSLPSEWNTHVVVGRNKPDLDTMSFDDLYNNFKIVKQEVKRTASSSSQNMAFVSSPSSTNEVYTAHEVSTANTQVSSASTQVSTASTQVSTANLNDLEEMDLKWQLALLSMRTKRFFQKTGRKITINGSDTAGYDKSKVECFNCHKMGHFARECRGPRNQNSRNRNQDSSRRTINMEETSSKAMVAIDGASFD
ncbi:ribonuclease H-like domain-containing protein, partial [Tanacetum coccineum]